MNLNAIVAHQAALAKECAKYHKLKAREFENLNKLSINQYDDEQNNEHQQHTIDNSDSELNARHIHWQNPIPVQVPAICLFGFSAFSHLAAWKPTDDDDDNNQHSKLDMVNWFYSDLEANHSSNKSKRHAQDDDDSALLEQYLFDPNAKPSENEIADWNEMSKFSDKIDKVLVDQSWQETIEQQANKLVSKLSPVILVPGLLGSRLQGRTSAEKKFRVNVFCSKNTDWKDMWLSLRQLLPLAVDCWLDSVRLEYNPQTGYTKQPQGVEVRVPDFGSVKSVNHLDLRQPQATEYFAKIIKRYEQLGYQAKVNLFAAPYDFRLAPQELTGYFTDLKRLIERASELSGKKKATLVCHSMGCTHLLVFLRLQSAAWRQKHVRKLIALSSPWAGSMKALKALVVGDQLDLPLVSEVKMRKLARTYPSIAFLLPQAEIFEQASSLHDANDGPVMVQTPERVYRPIDLPDLLRDLNLTHQLDWFKETSSLIKPLEPLPDLRVDCIHSLNTLTPESLIFKNQQDFPDGQYELVKGNGDGTVNIESLMVCAQWASQLPDKVKHKIITNTNHVGILSHKMTLTHITEDVLMN